MSFACQRGQIDLPELHKNNSIVSYESSGRFLGVYIDDRLKSETHIDHLCKKVSKSVGIIYRLKIFNLRRVLFQFIMSLVYPYLTYCNLAWGTTFECHLDPLITFQKRIIRIINNNNKSLFRTHDT